MEQAYRNQVYGYMEIVSQLTVILDVSIALVLGGILGFEREWKNKPAGLRTNMIIAGSSALLVSLGRIIVLDFNELINLEGLGIDPVRVLQAIIVGISFIGAGTILKSNDGKVVHYLTTSATILMSSAIGISIALKQYILGVAVTAILIIINYFFSYLNKIIGDKSEN